LAVRGDVIRDPVMSLAGLVVAPPALFFLRKLVRRVRSIAHAQFTGGTRIVETVQEPCRACGW